MRASIGRAGRRVKSGSQPPHRHLQFQSPARKDRLSAAVCGLTTRPTPSGMKRTACRVAATSSETSWAEIGPRDHPAHASEWLNLKPLKCGVTASQLPGGVPPVSQTSYLAGGAKSRT
jgi:hypothetical protein